MLAPHSFSRLPRDYEIVAEKLSFLSKIFRCHLSEMIYFIHSTILDPSKIIYFPFFQPFLSGNNVCHPIIKNVYVTIYSSIIICVTGKNVYFSIIKKML